MTSKQTSFDICSNIAKYIIEQRNLMNTIENNKRVTTQISRIYKNYQNLIKNHNKNIHKINELLNKSYEVAALINQGSVSNSSLPSSTQSLIL